MSSATLRCRIIFPAKPGFRIIGPLLSGVLLTLCLLAGCASKDKLSSGIIPPEKMKTIVWDMIQADSYTDLYPGKDSASRVRPSNLRLYAQVLQLHQVSHEEFRKSFQFYIDRPDLSRQLFDSVQALAVRDRDVHPYVQEPKPLPVPAKGAFPVPAKGAGPMQFNQPHGRPGAAPVPFIFHGRAPHDLPGKAAPASPAPNPSLRPKPGMPQAKQSQSKPPPTKPYPAPPPGTHAPVSRLHQDSLSRRIRH
jgi:hypothetical protein